MPLSIEAVGDSIENTPAPASTAAPHAPSSATDAPAAGAPPSDDAHRPAFGAPRTRPPRRWREILVAAGLAVLLALQLLVSQRDSLAADARWRPVVESLCGVLRCTVPAWREPEAFAMISRSVTPDPATPGVLVAEASFRNDARWPQPWPTVWIELSDIDGPVAARAFKPDEYRQAHDARATIAPGQSVTLRLRLKEPAPRIVAYMFDFR